MLMLKMSQTDKRSDDINWQEQGCLNKTSTGTKGCLCADKVKRRGRLYGLICGGADTPDHDALYGRTKKKEEI